MDKMVRMATVVAGVGTMLCFAGCGSAESEYQAYLDKAVKQERMTKSEAEKNMKEFKKESSEHQKMLLEMAKALGEEK